MFFIHCEIHLNFSILHFPHKLLQNLPQILIYTNINLDQFSQKHLHVKIDEKLSFT